MKVEPERETVFPENVFDRLWRKRVKIIRGPDIAPKPLGISSSDIWNVTKGERSEEFLDVCFVKSDVRSKWLVDLAEHLCPDSRV